MSNVIDMFGGKSNRLDQLMPVEEYSEIAKVAVVASPKDIVRYVRMEAAENAVYCGGRAMHGFVADALTTVLAILEPMPIELPQYTLVPTVHYDPESEGDVIVNVGVMQYPEDDAETPVPLMMINVSMADESVGETLGKGRHPSIESLTFTDTTKYPRDYIRKAIDEMIHYFNNFYDYVGSTYEPTADCHTFMALRDVTCKTKAVMVQFPCIAGITFNTRPVGL